MAEEKNNNTEQNAPQGGAGQQEPKQKSSSLWIAVAVVAVVLLAAGAFYMMSSGTPATEVETEGELEEMQEQTEEQTEEMNNEEVALETLQIQLNEQNNSGQSGSALLEELGDGTTRVTLNTTGGLAGPHPAHIHSGTCEELGGVEYPLENVEEGYSQTVVQASFAELMEGAFAINVHMSPEEIGVFTSCGDIV